MKMRFKHNTEPCIQYDVKSNVTVTMYDDILNKYCECFELGVIGYVPVELLTEANHPDNVDAVDVYIKATEILNTIG